MRVIVRLAFGFLGLAAQCVWGQTDGLALDSPYALEAYVTGRASFISSRVIVYDMSYPVRTKLGEAPVDKNGTFGIAVKPALVEGHVLVVEDAQRRISPPVVVLPQRAGPSRSSALVAIQSR